jgi:putative transposase
MANTFTQLHIHIVFAVKYRQALIDFSWREDLQKYITGIVEGEGHKMLAIKARPDHLHFFIGYNLNKLIPKLVEQVKTHSDTWIKSKGLCRGKFQWQRGYAAVSHSHSQVQTVINYILNQDEHHSRRTFRQEFLALLERYGIPWDERYLFDFFDDDLPTPAPRTT